MPPKTEINILCISTIIPISYIISVLVLFWT